MIWTMHGRSEELRGLLVTLLLMLSLMAPHTAGQTPWKLTTLYNFTGQGDGAQPSSGLIACGEALYGTTQIGGVGGGSTAFALTPPSTPGQSWQETTLHSFHGGNDGAFIYGGLACGAGGILYGTSERGGAWGHGTVFSLTPPTAPGEPWT